MKLNYNMSIWDRLFGKGEAKRTEASTRSRDLTFYKIGDQDVSFLVGDKTTAAGVHVSEASALTVSTFYRGCRVISESVGGMPFKLYRHADRSEAKDHPLFHVLRHEPNPDMGAVEFFTQLMFWAVGWNNAYAEIVRRGDDSVAELWPIHPGRVTVEYDEAGKLVYDVSNDEFRVRFPARDILHIKGPSEDGAVGSRLVRLARESLGFTIATERHGSSYFGNGAKPGAVITLAGDLTPESKETLRKSWNMLHQGPENAGKVAFLTNGDTYTPIPVNNEAGQFTETRQFQVYEVCRWLGVDPIFLYEYGRATWNNAEQQTRNFLQFSLNPWLKKLESEVQRKCLSLQERNEFYPEFVREAVIQMDTKTQHEVWEIGTRIGIYSPNDIFRFQNRPTVEGGDVYSWQKPEPSPVVEQPVEQPDDDQGDGNEEEGANGSV